MKTLKVNFPDKEYNIYIGSDILCNAAEYISRVFDGKKAVIVSDYNVNRLYGNAIRSALSDFVVKVIEIPPGEASKSLEMLAYLYREFAEFSLSRNDLVISFGGGVVGDLTGFAAATYLRGVRFVQIPTTLLSQVDSSVGGKCAINLNFGKNMAGAFYQPLAVISDTSLLKTLPQCEFESGMAEVIKYAAIADADMFMHLERLTDLETDRIIFDCCGIKRNIVRNDERDNGGRMVLNFGHTFAHAIEKYYDFDKYTHGQAVALGMLMACRFGEASKITEVGTADRLSALLRAYNLPTETDADAEALTEIMKSDKKAADGTVKLIVLQKIGKAVICPCKINELRGCINE